MKPTELMIGDWVRFKGSDLAHQVYAIAGKSIKVDKGNWFAASTFEPIPLTAEILERNGIRYQYGMPWYQGGADGVFEFRYRSDDDSTEVRKPVRYVHQLQHILKDCGIEKEVEL